MAKGSRGGKRGKSTARTRIGTVLKDGEVQLQQVGRVPAIKAEKLKAGDTLMWNGGYVSKVISITPKGKSSVIIKTDKGERVRKASTLTVSDAVKGTEDTFRRFATRR